MSEGDLDFLAAKIGVGELDRALAVTLLPFAYMLGVATVPSSRGGVATAAEASENRLATAAVNDRRGSGAAEARPAFFEVGNGFLGGSDRGDAVRYHVG